MDEANPNLALCLPEIMACDLGGMVAELAPPDNPGLGLESASLLDYLAQVLLDPKLFSFHLSWLIERSQGAEPFVPPDNGSFTTQKIDDLIASGLQSLDDDSLICLTCDPILLARVRKHLSSVDEFPAVWQDALSKLERRVFGDSDSSDEPSVEDELRESESFEWTARDIYTNFGRRAEMESQAISTFDKLPDSEKRKIVAGLKNLQSQMLLASGHKFNKLDVDFHHLLSRVAPHICDYDVVGFVMNCGARFQMTENCRLKTWIEHQAIVDALEKYDCEGAATASRTHLKNARKRWLPNVEQQTIRKNAALYEHLTGDTNSILCVCTLNVLPIEMDLRWPVMVEAAAAAVGRGAVLLYFRPTKALIDDWIARGWLLNPVSEFEIRSSFVALVSFVIEWLISSGQFKTKRDARKHVELHLAQFEVEKSELFSFVHADSTAGYFQYDDKNSNLTYRDPLSDSEAWLQIRKVPANVGNANEAKTYVSMVQEVLVELSESPQPPDRLKFIKEGLKRLRFEASEGIINHR